MSSFSEVSIAPLAGGEDHDADDVEGQDDGGDSNEEKEKEQVEGGKKEVEDKMEPIKDALNIYSRSFDASRAINDNAFDLTFAAGTTAMDNVDKLIAVSEGKTDGQPKAKKEEAKKEVINEEDKPLHLVVFGRRFTEDQMPIKSRAKQPRNVLHFMRKCKGDDGGPMSVLAKCVSDGTKVRVMLRGAVSMRGSCTGYVVAFDKHWNLAIVDVDETFTRKRHGKASVRELEDELAEKLSVGEKASTRTEVVGASVLRVIKQRRKTELCERHVPQMVLRGEHVAAIVVLR
jgi:small nuclear ribonucleoprotein (snRNP)-like protein